MKHIISYIFVVLLFVSCAQSNKSSGIDSSLVDAGLIKYAQGLKVSNHEHYRLVDIQDPQQASSSVYKYALINRGESREGIPSDYQIIEIPISKVICMTNLQIANFIKLDAIDRIVGMTSTNYLFNEDIKARLTENKISKIGIEGNFDGELVIALDPDVILVSPFKKGGYEAIKTLDVPLLTFLGYKETTPLGQAEWMKLVGMLVGEEKKANELFAMAEKRYKELEALCADIDKRPTVLSGELHSGNWYVVGGKSFLAEQIRDAGAKYFLTDNDETGGLQYDFEAVYAQGANADYWRLLVSHTGDYSYDVLKATDARYVDFKAYKERKVVCCNLRQKPFYEKAPVEPEVVLADLIKAFHPHMLPDHTPVYYELLKD